MNLFHLSWALIKMLLKEELFICIFTKIVHFETLLEFLSPVFGGGVEEELGVL